MCGGGVRARQSSSANSARKAHHSVIDVARPPRRERVVLAPSRGTRRPAGSAPARTHQDGGVVGRRSPAHGAGEECHQHEPQVSHSARTRSHAVPWLPWACSAAQCGTLLRSQLGHEPEEPGAQHARASSTDPLLHRVSCRHGAAVLLR